MVFASDFKILFEIEIQCQNKLKRTKYVHRELSRENDQKTERKEEKKIKMLM